VLLAILIAMIGSLNDLIYKKNSADSGNDRKCLFFSLAAVFSAMYCFLYIIAFKGGFHFKLLELAYGTGIGFISFAVYILFLFSFDGINTSISITIFRMNLIPSIIIAMIFIDETITIKRGIGIALCIIAMLLLSSKMSGQGIKKKYLLLSLAACLGCAALNFANKFVSMHGLDPFFIMFWRFSTVSVVSFILLFFIKPGSISARDFKYPAISGLLLLLSVLCTLVAFKSGNVNLVTPIGQMSFILTSLYSWAVYKERMNATKLVGISCGVLAVIMIV
jgi:Predicted membrane protein